MQEYNIFYPYYAFLQNISGSRVVLEVETIPYFPYLNRLYKNYLYFSEW